MRPAVLCVVLTACTGLNPAFDPPAPTASAGETSQSTTSPGDSTTTQPVDPTTSSTSSMSMTQSDTSGPEDSSGTATSAPASSTTDASTTGPLCTPQNEACDADLSCCGECATCTNGTCVLDDSLCGTCGVCNAGSCEPAKQNTLCVPDQDDCVNRVWGLVDGVCYATKPAGLCDKDGACVPDCQDQGAVIAMCGDPRCVVIGACVSGGDPDKISLETLCHHEDAPAGECIPNCNQEGTIVVANACNASGMCVPIDELPCEPYVCTGLPGQCTNTCTLMEDCAPNHTCMNNVCT